MALFIVTNTLDSGAGSLRQALADAEANGVGADEIEFDASLDGQTITLASQLAITQGAVTVSGDLDGDGDADITISGGNTTGILDIEAGSDVTLNSLVLADGNAVGQNAGGYYDFGSSTFIGEAAEAGAGAINNRGTLAINYSVLRDNTGQGGSGYFNAGYSANYAAETGAGAILNAGQLTISQSVLRDNSGTGGDGGSYYSYNGGDGGDAAGGILNLAGGTVTLDIANVSSNIDSNGGTGGDGGNDNLAPTNGGDGGDAALGLLNLGTIAGSGPGNGALIASYASADGIGGPGGNAGGGMYYGYGAPGTPGMGGTTINNGTGMLNSRSDIGTENADTVTGLANYSIFHGLGGADTIEGANNTYLYGGAGNDMITAGQNSFVMGGLGNDTIVNTYVFSGTFDGGDGIDTIDVSSDLTSPDFVLDMETGVASYAATMTNFENAIGVDGGNGDTISGTSGANIISGLGGNDVLDGRLGNDTLSGGTGDDTFVYNRDGTAGTTDTVTDFDVAGGDRIDLSTAGIGEFATIQELLMFSGGAFSTLLNGFTSTLDLGVVDPSTLTASEFIFASGTGAQTINGTGNDDDLFGADGNDTLLGGGGQDFLFGEADNDLLDGGTGADRMVGGLGNDIYVIDDLGDMAVETGLNFDIVRSSVTANLSDVSRFSGAFEAITLTGTGAINAIGNLLNNIMTGNSASNVMNGLAGADNMRGRGGGDVYVVDNAGDIVDETIPGSNGFDRILSSVSINLSNTAQIKGGVERVELTGSANVNVVGNLLINSIVGNSGNNIINGLTGNDVLTGGGGADSFVFSTGLGLTGPSGANVDQITDFDTVQDRILLDDAIFGALGPTVSASEFRILGSGLQDADDFLLYNENNGALFYDADGAGGANAVLFAVLNGAPSVDAGDFTII